MFNLESNKKFWFKYFVHAYNLFRCLTLSCVCACQAAFNITKPAVLQQQLSEGYKLDEDKVEAFVSTWTSQAKNIVGALKRKSVYPKQV